LVWLDLVEPTLADLEPVPREYGPPPLAVKDCLGPEHLPMFERFERATFAILRAYDERSPAEADTVQGLTRKVALFYGPDFLVTIHRKEQPSLDVVIRPCQGGTPALPLTFIVGVYGINFTHMPELSLPWGYPAVLVLMAGVSGAIWAWFRRRGWS
jgi:magnesium transporter